MLEPQSVFSLGGRDPYYTTPTYSYLNARTIPDKREDASPAASSHATSRTHCNHFPAAKPPSRSGNILPQVTEPECRIHSAQIPQS